MHALDSKCGAFNNTVILGPDRAKFGICADSETNENGRREAVNEIKEYWSGRYLSAPEAVWRILGYNIAQKTPQ